MGVRASGLEDEIVTLANDLVREFKSDMSSQPASVFGAGGGERERELGRGNSFLTSNQTPTQSPFNDKIRHLQHPRPPRHNSSESASEGMGSPTSLANLAGVSTKRRREFVKRVPFHRQLATALRQLPLRARVVLSVALLILLWRLTHASPSSRSANASRNDDDKYADNDLSVTGPTPSIKSLPFAPTQVRRTSAKIRFRSGVVQEVFVPAPPTPSHGGTKVLQDEEQELWKEGLVQAVDVPIGASLSFQDRWNRTKKLERGDSCAEGYCDDMRSVTLAQDVLLGLQQIMDSPPSTPLLLRIPTRQYWRDDDVTLVTQFSVSRLYRFERTLLQWDGPISLTIYLTDREDAESLLRYLSSDASKMEMYRNVALTIVKPDYSSHDAALIERLRYPINRLRNLALEIAPTQYTVVTDADFVPSPDMHSILQSRGVPLIDHPSSPSSDSPTLKRTAIVISAFALSDTHDGPYPSTPLELSQHLFSHPPLASLTDVNSGHGPSLPSLLFEAVSPRLVSPLDYPPAIWSYEICYEPQWEPYYLLHRPSHPLYDERFSDQGGDKQSHALLLNALGYDFKVLRDVWFMHPSKGGEDKEVDEWPSARLARTTDEEGDVGGERKDDPAHFSVAQKDKNRYRYFQDYLPEMEERWGWNVRWPRGCSGRAVGGRCFGRARAGTVFGL